MMDEETRLNKMLAFRAGISRREADDLISKGRVTINGSRADIGARVKQDDAILVDGKKLTNTTKFIYLLLNKPEGYVCSRKQQGTSPTIYSLLPNELHSLKTVGRLDRNSSGLIILTNDGDFAQLMTHPRYQKVKRYEIKLDKDLQPLHQQMISDFGVDLEDGKSKLHLEPHSESRTNWGVIMHEGRNRQIRRTFGALGYIVDRLHRTDFGPYSLHGIVSGKYIFVEKK